MIELNEYTLSAFAQINPKVQLRSGVSYSFVEMRDLNEQYKIVKPSAMRELAGGARFQDGDTLFARITPCLENGKICQVAGLDGGHGFGSTEFLVFRGRPGVSDNDFVYYLCKTPIVRRYAEQNLVGTSGRQRVSREAFDNLILDLPTLPMQCRIANVLSSFDDKIELNKQMNQTLEEMAQALFKHHFVDGIDEGNLPDGWNLQKLSEEIDIKHGYAFKGEFFSDAPTKEILITPGNFRIGGGFNYGKYKYYRSSYPEDYIFAPEDLMVTMTDLSVNGDTLGYSALVPTLPEVRLLHNQRIGKVIFKSKPYLKYYLYWLMRTDRYRSFVLGSASGTTVKHTSPSRICDYSAIIPSENAVRGFNETARSFYQQEQSNINENIYLEQLRDYLLPKLIAGEIIPYDLKQLESAL